jgi:hypothetical protein
VLILPATAESTGGLCTACKQGIRKSIDASRAYYERLKKYDPFRELWKSLVKRSSNDPGLSRFSVAEQRYFAVSLLEGEVYNGGFDQFFWNSSGDYYNVALAGLEEIGASSSLAIVKKAAETVFGSSEPPGDQASRWAIMGSKVRQLSEVSTRFRQASRLERLDKEFCEDPDGLGECLAAYAEDKGLVTPFLRDRRAT